MTIIRQYLRKTIINNMHVLGTIEQTLHLTDLKPEKTRAYFRQSRFYKLQYRDTFIFLNAN